jgi:CysZ protein
MLSDATLAFNQIFSPPFRSVFWKAIGLTLLLLAALWAALQGTMNYFVVVPWPGVETAISILTGLGLLIGLGFALAPVTSLFAGLFLDDIAEIVEETSFPQDPPGRAMPIMVSIITSVRFFGIVLLVNLFALPMVLLLGFGYLVFFVANGYLLGREYFEMAALRFSDKRSVTALRQRNGAQIFMAGLLIAGFMAVPLLNILTPLFATAFMVHTHKRLAARTAGTQTLAGAENL